MYWIADLAEKSLPFVVNISTEIDVSAKRKQASADGNKRLQQSLPPEFRQLLPEPFNQQMDQQMPEDHPPVGGEGSGFVYRKDGYIVTNQHVVDGADKFTVRMNDGKEYSAKLIGADALKDIAVLKVDAGNLPVAPLADSDKVRVGEPVIAIGSPLGYEATVTAGIVSTNHRKLSDLGQAQDPRSPQTYLQTDAAINRGNSGGPLLNAQGQVIGVNRAIARWDSDGFTQIPIEGIGFAIPINDVKSSIEAIVLHADEAGRELFLCSFERGHRIVAAIHGDLRGGQIIVRLLQLGVEQDHFLEILHRVGLVLLFQRDVAEKIIRRRVGGIIAHDGFELGGRPLRIARAQIDVGELGAQQFPHRRREVRLIDEVEVGGRGLFVVAEQVQSVGEFEPESRGHFARGSGPI